MWSGACVVCGKVGVRRRGPRSSAPLCSQRCRHIFRTGGSEMGACKCCGAPYPRSCGRQYCSVACRKGGGRCSYDRVCLVCGRAFAGTRRTVRYCSPACVGRARRTSFLKKRSAVYDGIDGRDYLVPKPLSRAELLQRRSEAACLPHSPSGSGVATARTRYSDPRGGGGLRRLSRGTTPSPNASNWIGWDCPTKWAKCRSMMDRITGNWLGESASVYSSLDVLK